MEGLRGRAIPEGAPVLPDPNSPVPLARGFKGDNAPARPVGVLAAGACNSPVTRLRILGLAALPGVPFKYDFSPL